ncbi:histidine phosphotransferase [Sphingobium sp. TomTYG45]
MHHLARQRISLSFLPVIPAAEPFMTNPTDSIEFASLLCSRLCHDLLSPVGALNNGLELMADETDPEMRQRCLDLLADSAKTSANKLKFFRLAFGSAGGFGDAVPTHEARVAIEGMFAAGRVKVGWLVDDDMLDKLPVKVLLNLALIAGDALVRGGQLDIGAEKRPGVTEIVVRAEGPKLVLDPDLRAALAGTLPEDSLASRTAAAWMIRSLVTSAGGEVALSPAGEPVLLFGASIPG